MDNLGLYIIITLAAIILILNIIATIIAAKTYFVVKARRYYQIALVWIIPIIGALLVIFINKEDYFHQKRERQVGNHPSIKQSDEARVYVAMHHKGGR